MAINSPIAIGRSNPVPTFRESPGDKLTVIRRDGTAKPEFARAATTRSRLSFTSPAGSPTMHQYGSPGATSTSTQMSYASTPTTAAERMAASTPEITTIAATPDTVALRVEPKPRQMGSDSIFEMESDPICTVLNHLNCF